MICSNFLEGDITKVIATFPNFQIRKQMIRGNRPYYTLHKRRKTLFSRSDKWGSCFRYSDELDKLQAYVLRYEGFPGDFMETS